LLLHLTTDGALAIDTSDQIQAGVVIAHDGRIVHEGVAGLLKLAQTQSAQTQPAEGGAGVDGPSD
jgi:NAD(P) transhydrogenase subunit alpha